MEILRQYTSNAAKWLAESGPNHTNQSLVDVAAVLADYENNIKLVVKDGTIFKNHL